MFKLVGVGIGAAIVSLVLGTTWTSAQQAPMTGGQMQHEQMMGHGAVQRIPTLSGQDAFGAIQEIVRILEADPATDWSKVSLERLRQHLIDMNEVTLRSEVKSTVVPGGLAMDVTGVGRTEQAIRRMVSPHSGELNKMSEWSASTEEIPGGIRLTVVAKTPTDAKTIARIRGLGFIGLLVQGGHHQPHHLAMAKGEEMAGHAH
ncbi:MAG: hypothetical protein NTW68_09375 [candidate division NC10 bacterium]|nr:hypothetical protein [candidate division NC10 bacterium]